MYILSIGRAFPEKSTGMIGIFEYEQAVALKKAGNKVIYAFSDNRSVKVIRTVKPYRNSKDGIEIYGRRLPIKGLPEGLFSKIKSAEFKKLVKTIIDENGVPDVIHIHFPLLTITSEIFGFLKTLGCKIVVTEHWTKVQKKELSSRKKELLCELAEKVDAFICVSSLLKKSVLELTGTKRNILVIPNMVSDEFGYADSRETDSSSYKFISISRLVPVKRFNIAIEGFTKAFKGNKDIKLTIVGDGKLYSSLKKQINSLGMSDQIIMTGFKKREEVAELLAESDCYVSASILETFGVPFIEAWVTGLPCIGVKGGPIDELFNSENGYLFKSDDSDDLAEVMKKMYAEKERFNRKNISENAVSLFSSSSVAARLLEVFENA